MRQAEKARTRLLNHFDDERLPRSGVTVGQLLDQHFELSTWERRTRGTCAGNATEHIRQLIGGNLLSCLSARGVRSVMHTAAAAKAAHVRLQVVIKRPTVTRVLMVLDVKDQLCIRSDLATARRAAL